MTALIITAVPDDVAAAAGRVRAELDRRGIPVFGTVDHGANARGAGLELPDEVVLIFGNPAVGTRLMQADPTVGIELPLRILIWDDHGTTRVAYRDPRELAAGHALGDQTAVLEGMADLLAQLVAAAA